jgi:DNA invertase Pin-like site-specific DNA recombinase
MAASSIKPLRCAIYTRKSTEHGLELEFNSLDAQRDACEAYVKSQASQGWRALAHHYDDPAYSGGNLDRPALQQLLKDIDAGRIDVIVVYKIDRLTRSLADFAKLVEAFDAKSIFVAVTQQFNTTTSMGRLFQEKWRQSLSEQKFTSEIRKYPANQRKRIASFLEFYLTLIDPARPALIGMLDTPSVPLELYPA